LISAVDIDICGIQMSTTQQELDFHVSTWGGRREGAGRPKKPGSGVAHDPRPDLKARHPVHVTMRVVPEVARMRKKRAYQAVRRALITSLGFSRWKGKLRVCHISIQDSHLHLLVEAESREALSRGMQGFLISCAKHLNAALGRKGRVFVDRYHAEQLTGPRRVRNALAYVLNNWRKHRADVGSSKPMDRFSSAIALPQWRPEKPIPWPDGVQLLPVWFPQTWLLREGWQKAGAISPWDRPGPRART
jgi:putative transposase